MSPRFLTDAKTPSCPGMVYCSRSSEPTAKSPDLAECAPVKYGKNTQKHDTCTQSVIFNQKFCNQ